MTGADPRRTRGRRWPRVLSGPYPGVRPGGGRCRARPPAASRRRGHGRRLHAGRPPWFLRLEDLADDPEERVELRPRRHGTRAAQGQGVPRNIGSRLRLVRRGPTVGDDPRRGGRSIRPVPWPALSPAFTQAPSRSARSGARALYGARLSAHLAWGLIKPRETWKTAVWAEDGRGARPVRRHASLRTQSGVPSSHPARHVQCFRRCSGWRGGNCWSGRAGGAEG